MNLKNFAPKAFVESNQKEKLKIKRFINSFKDDIIVGKSGGSNDANSKNERTENQSIR